MIRIVLFRRYGLFGRQWYFRITGANGEPMAHSEGYRDHNKCRKTADKLKDGLGTAIISDPVAM